MKKTLFVLSLFTLLALTACGTGLQGSFRDRDAADIKTWTPEVTSFFLNDEQKLVAEFKVSKNPGNGTAVKKEQTFTYSITLDTEEIATNNAVFSAEQEVTLISPSVADMLKEGQHEAIACIHEGTPAVWTNGIPSNSSCKNLRF